MLCLINAYISEINNTQVDNAKNIDKVMPIFNQTEYSNNFRNHQKFLL